MLGLIIVKFPGLTSCLTWLYILFRAKRFHVDISPVLGLR